MDINNLATRKITVTNLSTGEELEIPELGVTAMGKALKAQESGNETELFEAYVLEPLRQVYGRKKFDKWLEKNDVGLSWGIPILLGTMKLLGFTGDDAEKKAQKIMNSVSKKPEKV